MELKEIKKHKGQLIRLTYNGNNKKIQTGKITAVTSDHILFKINNENEISIKFEKVKEIEPLKLYSHYIRTVKRYITEENYQKALSILDSIKNTFKLEYQIKEIKDLILLCINKMWQKHENRT